MGPYTPYRRLVVDLVLLEELGVLLVEFLELRERALLEDLEELEHEFVVSWG